MSEDARTIVLLRKIIFILSGLLILTGIGIVVYRKVHARQLRLAALNTKVRELELTAIRAQMNPHFLYNSLNSIQNLVQKTRTEDAYNYLSKFATLIRNVLNYSSREEISLYEELEMIGQYIKLEQLRFEFDFRMQISPDVDTYSLSIPPLILQPLVENAIIHGLAPKKDKRQLLISVDEEGDTVCIIINDNGVGRRYAEDNSSGNGKGLNFSRERLNLIAKKTGQKYSFNISDQTDSSGNPLGTMVKICFSKD